MPTVETRDFDDVTEALGEQAIVELAEHPRAVLIDWANAVVNTQQTLLAVVPLLMSCDSFEHFAERLAPRRPAEIKDSKSCGRHPVLQEGILDGLSERVGAALALRVYRVLCKRGWDQSLGILPSN